MLEAVGLRAETVVDEGMLGADDRTVFEEVDSEGGVLITLDRDLGDVRRYREETSSVVIYIRLRSTDRGKEAAILQRVLSEHDVASLRGMLIAADASKSRARRIPAWELIV